jgi:hypothetical protein
MQQDPWKVIQTKPLPTAAGPSAPDDPWSVVTPQQTETQPAPGIASQLLTTGLNTMVNAGTNAVQPFIHPLDFAKDVATMPYGVLKSHADQGQKAWDAFQRGDRSEGVLRAIASVVPLVGPLLANYADSDQAGKEQIAGNVIGGIAQGKMMTGALSAPKAADAAAEALRTSATDTTAKAMGPSGMDARAEALAIAPEMQARGIRGTRAQQLATVQSGMEKTGVQMDTALDAAKQAGGTIPNAGVRALIQKAKDPMFTPDKNGAPVLIPDFAARFKQLDELDKFVSELPDDIPVEQAKNLKSIYGKIADEAGMYGQNATEVEKAKGWAAKQLQSALRQGLASGNPDLAALDKEYSFWKRANDILDPAVLKDRTSSGPSLVSRAGAEMAAGSVAGGSAGFALGGPVGATVGALVGPSVAKLMASPWWKTTVSAPLKSALADAIASGSNTRIAAITKSIIASLPSTLTVSGGQPMPVRSLFIGATGAGSGAATGNVTGNTGRMGGPGGRGGTP